MCGCRVLLFRLHESPKWLSGAGRTDDAVLVLQSIARDNGKPLDALGPDDVVDTPVADLSKSAELDAAAGRASYDGRYSPIRASTIDDVPSQRPPPGRRWTSVLPERVADAVEPYLDRIAPLFAPDMIRLTVLVWAIWTLVSIAYSIFNVWLPSWLGASVVPRFG